MACYCALGLCCAQPRASAAETKPIRLRIVWGGGAATRWQGTITPVNGLVANIAPLGTAADEPGSMWIDGNRVVFVARSPRANDGVDLDVTAELNESLKIEIQSDVAGKPQVVIEAPLQTLVNEPYTRELDERGNQLVIRRAPGDKLHLGFDRDSLIYAPAETLKCRVTPLLIGDNGPLRCRAQLRDANTGRAVWSEEPAEPLADSADFSVAMKLPTAEGVYNLELELIPRRGPLALGLKPLATRRAQIVVLAKQPRLNSADGRRPLDLVLEIDPAKPHWWDRLGNLPTLPGMRKGSFGTGDADPWQHALGAMVQLGPGGSSLTPSWEAYPLSVQRVGAPHVVEIEYPSDVPQTVGISLVEPGPTGEAATQGVDSGFYVPDEAAATEPKLLRHRVIFWPRTRTPLLLISNLDARSQAVFGKIRVLAHDGTLPARFPSDGGDGARLIAAYYDRPLFAANFSAPEAYDAGSGRSLTDWSTFYLGSSRLIEYLKHVGYNGLTLSVLADGATLYPSVRAPSTPRFDNGALFSTAQDPLQKDVLELLLRMFDREKLQLIPAISFAAPLASLEELKRQGGDAAAGLEWVGRDGHTWLERYAADQGRAPYYNTLDPRVQDAMLAIIDELLARYGEHSSLTGVALQLSGYGYAQLPGLAWGFDDRTIAAFEHDTGVQIAGDGPRRFALRAQALLGPQRKAWSDWRARRMTEFYQRIEARVTQSRPGARLYLCGAEMFNGPDLLSALRPSLPPRPLDDALVEAGIAPELEKLLTSTVLLRPQQLSAPGPLDSRLLDLKINDATELDRRLRDAAVPACLLYHEPYRVAIPSFDEQSPFRNSHLTLVAQLSPSGERNRQRFAHALATLNAQALFDGGWMLPLGQEDELVDVFRAYRRLPAVSFQSLDIDSQPVAIRAASHNGATQWMLVNDSPWPVQLQLDLSVAPQTPLTELTGRRRIAPLSPGKSGSQWQVELRPYDLLAVELATATAAITSAKVDLPETAAVELASRISDFQARAIALQSLPPLETLENGDFESPPATDGAIASWLIGSGDGVDIQLDHDEKHAGENSLRITSTGRPAVVVSHASAPPVTGRIEVAVWLRSRGDKAAPVRIAVEGSHRGQPFYRYAMIGDGRSGVALSSDWKQYLVPFDNLPLEAINDLKLRFELLGAGVVWIDDAQLFPLKFSEDERLELIKLYTSAQYKLSAGQVGDCLHMLDSYWPQFLTAHVPLTETPVAQRPPDRQAALPADLPKPPAEEHDGLFDRFKQWLPSRWR
ncbi:MAG: family 10 glycosylhydrolase [Pirellulales bacterium]|nr:family 10 glycosylhydrolase [Pirellulales bacterium]